MCRPMDGGNEGWMNDKTECVFPSYFSQLIIASRFTKYISVWLFDLFNEIVIVYHYLDQGAFSQIGFSRHTKHCLLVPSGES